MSLRSNFSQTKFNKTNSLVRNNKTFLLFTYGNVETNKFTKLRKVLSNFNAKLHFARTNHIKLALGGLFPKGVAQAKGQCLLITIPSFEFEVLQRLSSFATANRLTPAASVRDKLLQPVADLNVFAKFKTSADVKLALLNCLRSPLNQVMQPLRAPLSKLLLSFPTQTSLNQC
ncbi:MAG: 50S ribosomal protein L10 [Candidatus Hodgkinia cicadicola]